MNLWVGVDLELLEVNDGVGSAQVKKGPLAETSPMLNDISGVPNWAKVCQS